MDPYTEYCDHCKKDIPKSNYLNHSIHCARNIVLCVKCFEPYPRVEMESHMEEVHSVAHCPMCFEVLEIGDLHVHSLSLCKKRIMICSICEVDIEADKMKDHLDYCGSRTDRCDGCGKTVLLKYRGLHLASKHKLLKPPATDDDDFDTLLKRLQNTAIANKNNTNNNTNNNSIPNVAAGRSIDIKTTVEKESSTDKASRTKNIVTAKKPNQNLNPSSELSNCPNSFSSQTSSAAKCNTAKSNVTPPNTYTPTHHEEGGATCLEAMAADWAIASNAMTQYDLERGATASSNFRNNPSGTRTHETLLNFDEPLVSPVVTQPKKSQKTKSTFYSDDVLNDYLQALEENGIGDGITGTSSTSPTRPTNRPSTRPTSAPHDINPRLIPAFSLPPRKYERRVAPLYNDNLGPPTSSTNRRVINNRVGYIGTNQVLSPNELRGLNTAMADDRAVRNQEIEDDLAVCLPCEFCEAPIPIDQLIIHQTGCIPEYTSLPPENFRD